MPKADPFCIGNQDFSFEYEAFPDDYALFLPIAQHGWNSGSGPCKVLWQIRQNAFHGKVAVEFWHKSNGKNSFFTSPNLPVCNRWTRVKIERKDKRLTIVQDGVRTLDMPMDYPIDCDTERGVDVGLVSQNGEVFTLTSPTKGRSTTGKVRNFILTINGREVFRQP